MLRDGGATGLDVDAIMVRARISRTTFSRDQADGVISESVDPDTTALALSLMNEQLLLEMVCRNGSSPEDYAQVTGPIWEAALFGGGDSGALRRTAHADGP